MQLRQVTNVAKSGPLNVEPLHINPNHSCAANWTSWNTEELLHDWKINGEFQVPQHMNNRQKGLSLTTEKC